MNVKKILKLLCLPVEAHLSKKPLAKSSPLFIVGAPRSGTTLAYQLVTEYIHCSFITNLINHNNDIPLTMSLVSLYLPAPKTTKFTSNYGNTVGRTKPSQGDQVWGKFLGKERTYHSNNTIDSSTLTEANHLIRRIAHIMKAPFVNKSITNSVKLNSILEAFPDARIVWVKREPFFIAQSNYFNWKRKPDLQWVSAKPNNYAELAKLSVLEKSTLQILSIERDIEKVIAQHDPKKVMTVNYEDICMKPSLFLQQVLTMWPDSKLREGRDSDILSLTPSNKIKLDDIEAGKIKEILTRAG
tara:strand:- start:3778 stop:4674 length:897 start_codon:yes stop_codon:yes gene_type:complete